MQVARADSLLASGNCRGTVRALVVVRDQDLDDGGVVAPPRRSEPVKSTGQQPGAVMHNNLHEKLARLHRDDLMAAARQSRLRAIVRATRLDPWPGRQR